MTEGTVKFFNRNRGFGFIAGDDKNEYFVHATGLKEGVKITEGDRVSFEVVRGDRGPKAEGVEKISKAKGTASAEEEEPEEKLEEEEEVKEEEPEEKAKGKTKEEDEDVLFDDEEDEEELEEETEEEEL